MSGRKESSFQSIESCFHGCVNYVMRWSIGGSGMVIELEDETAYWGNELDADFIENITRKTGSFKKFHTFAKMFESALQIPTKELYADILTVQDLELLKHRNNNSSMNTTKIDTKSNNKRYLIITYVTAYDRVHYPLPLLPCTEPSPEMLLRTINRLRTRFASSENLSEQISEQRRKDQLISELEEENRNLAAQLKKLKAANKKTKEIASSNSEIRDTFEKAKEKWELERNEKTEEINHLRKQLQSKGSAIEHLKEIKTLQITVQTLEAELRDAKAATQRMLNRQKKELELGADELNRLRLSNKQLRARIKELSSSPRGLSSSSRISDKEISKTSSRSSTGSRLKGTTSTSTRGRTSDIAAKRRTQSPSPVGVRTYASSSLRRRFDPTAYQREREAKLKTVAARKTRGLSNASSGYTSADSETSRVSNRSKSSRLSKGSKTSQRSKASSKGSRNGTRNAKPVTKPRTGKPPVSKSSIRRSEPALYHTKRQTPNRDEGASTSYVAPSETNHEALPQSAAPPGPPAKSAMEHQTQGGFDAVDSSMDMSEIDSRLNALQEFLKQAKMKL